jgi:GntR family carbon starvation induced transcriptional regulator
VTVQIAIRPRPRDSNSDAPEHAATLAEVAFDRIREDILRGQLAPEEKLRIDMLKHAYSIGPSPLREALSRLVSTGLVIARGQQGFFVAPISVSELCDITKNRIWAVSMALRLAIARATRESEATVIAAAHVMGQRPQDPSGLAHWDAHHNHFHFALVANCGSPHLLRHCAQLQELSDRYRWLSMSEETRSPRNADEEHRKLRDAVLDRNADLAVELIAAHLMATATLIIRKSCTPAEAKLRMEQLRLEVSQMRIQS